MDKRGTNLIRGIPTRALGHLRALRAFSLIEVLVVVAIIGILASIAVPAIGPQIDIARLETSAEVVASFVARAQAEAIASRRCVRVWLDTPGALETADDIDNDNTTYLVADKLNVYDCDVSPSTAPKISASAGLWINVARKAMDAGVLDISWDTIPSSTSASALGGGEPTQFRFRPSGRLFSNDANSSGVMTVDDVDVTDDDGVLVVTHGGMEAGIARTKKILVEAQGLICVLPRGVSPAGSGNNLSCP